MACKKSKRRMVMSDESINRYGFRVLTSGINLDDFKKNPILLYAHLRDEGSKVFGDYKPIGHWEDIEVSDGVLSAVPVFDCVDELSQTVCEKYEAGTFSACSIGFRVISTSSDKEFILPGQKRETVTKCDLLECSIVDIPANANAVRLYDGATSVLLAAGAASVSVPEIKQSEPMNLKETFSTLLTFLGISKEKAETTELTAENLSAIEAEMTRLKNALSEKETSLSAKDEEVKTLKAEKKVLEAMQTTLKTEKETLAGEAKSLKEQVEALKQAPSAGATLAPKNEKEEKTLSAIELAVEFCKENPDDENAIAEKMKELGLAY